MIEEEEQQQAPPPLPAGYGNYVDDPKPAGGSVNANITATAQEVLDGKVNLQRYRQMTTGRYAMQQYPGLADEVRRLAAAQGKDYGDDILQRRYQVLSDYNGSTIGRMGGQIAAANTALRHAQDFKDLIEASNNGDTRVVNAIRNRLATEFGGTLPRELHQIGHVLGAEVERSITGGVPTVEGTRQITGVLDPNASKEQLQKAADNMIQVTLDKMRSHKDTLESAGINTKRFPVIRGNVNEILKKNSFDPEALVKYTPEQLGAQAGSALGSLTGGGYVRHAKSQNGHTIGQKADGAWYDVQTGKRIQ